MKEISPASSCLAHDELPRLHWVRLNNTFQDSTCWPIARSASVNAHQNNLGSLGFERECNYNEAALYQILVYSVVGSVALVGDKIAKNLVFPIPSYHTINCISQAFIALLCFLPCQSIDPSKGDNNEI